MRGTPSCSTTSACLPIERRTWQKASAEPTASPSGRACEVSTNRSRCPICRSTSASMSLCLFSPRPLLALVALLCPVQQLLDACLGLLGAIQPEIQFGSAPDAQTLKQFMADVFPRCLQPFETATRLSVVALHVDPN